MKIPKAKKEGKEEVEEKEAKAPAVGTVYPASVCPKCGYVEIPIQMGEGEKDIVVAHSPFEEIMLLGSLKHDRDIEEIKEKIKKLEK